VEKEKVLNQSRDELLEIISSKKSSWDQIHDAAIAAYPSYEGDLKLLQSSMFLPERINKEKKAIDLTRLLYLTTWDDLPGKSPFSPYQGNIFMLSKRMDRRTARWLYYGIPIVTFLSLISLLGLLGLIANYSPSVIISTLIITSATISVAIFSFLATGTYPDASSRAANEAQNEMHVLEAAYEAMAYLLINMALSKNKEQNLLAEVVASRLNLKEIKSAIIQQSFDQHGHLIVDPLAAAVKYIKDGYFPVTQPRLGDHIEVKLLKFEKKKLEAIVVNLLKEFPSKGSISPIIPRNGLLDRISVAKHKTKNKIGLLSPNKRASLEPSAEVKWPDNPYNSQL